MSQIKLTILETVFLSDGYCELILQLEDEFKPPPGPGHYICTTFAVDAPRIFLPIIGLERENRLRVLFHGKPLTGKTLQHARIEGLSVNPDPTWKHLVLITENAAIACAIFAASLWRKQYTLTVFSEFNTEPPFRPAPSKILMPACPADVIAAVPLLDDWNIPSRLASPVVRSGFFHGKVYGLLEAWWQRLTAAERQDMQLLGYGSRDFIRRLEDWCRNHAVPAQTTETPG
ncbi:MAG TPA: hypothetical protein VGL10_04795 [Gammaproteobacteria bacterium]